MTQFETTCPNEHSVKFTLEMCGRTAQCPKCSARFEVPTLKEVREMLGDEIDEELEAEFKDAEIKIREKLKARAAKLKEAKEKAEREAKEKAEREAAEEAGRRAEEEANEEMIQFLCPNGHELSASVRQAGKKGRCPDCGAKFIVPTLEALESSDGSAGAADAKKNPFANLDSTEEDPANEDSGNPFANLDFAPDASRTASDASAETQVSPAAGTGSNPDPSADSSPESGSDAELELEIAPPVPKISVSKNLDGRPFLYPNLAIGESGEIDLGLEEARRSIPEALRMDPMAKFFWTLWTSNPASESSIQAAQEADSAPSKSKTSIVGNSIRSARSGRIELQTADGKTYIPTEFYEDKSLSPIGFFEALDPNGKPITLVIRWENVVRIVVRQ